MIDISFTVIGYCQLFFCKCFYVYCFFKPRGGQYSTKLLMGKRALGVPCRKNALNGVKSHF